MNRTGIAGRIQSHPIAAFLTLSLLGSYALLTIMVLVERGVLPGRGVPGLVGADMEEAASLVLVLTLLASALVVTYSEGGRPAVAKLLERAVRWRVPVRWWGLAVLVLPLTSLALALAFGDTLAAPSVGTLVDEAVAVIVALVLANLGEETAWAGFFQTRLERRHQFFVAAAMTAVPFALVHVPIRVVTHEIAGPKDVAGNLVALLIISLIVRTLLGIVLRGALNSVLLVAVTHTSFNRSNNVDGIVADLVEGQARSFAALLASLLVTIVLAIGMRRRLTRANRIALDDAESRASSPTRTAAASQA